MEVVREFKEVQSSRSVQKTKIRREKPQPSYRSLKIKSQIEWLPTPTPTVGTNDMSTTKEGDTRISLVMSESKYRWAHVAAVERV